MEEKRERKQSRAVAYDSCMSAEVPYGPLDKKEMRWVASWQKKADKILPIGGSLCVSSPDGRLLISVAKTDRHTGTIRLSCGAGELAQYDWRIVTRTVKKLEMRNRSLD